MPAASAAEAVEAVFREEWGRITASLIAMTGTAMRSSSRWPSSSAAAGRTGLTAADWEKLPV